MFSRQPRRTCLKTLLPVIVIILVGISQLISGISTSFASPPSQERNIESSPMPSLASVCPLSINLGETIQCSITTAGEIDSYTFYANAGDKVLVRMSRASGTLTLHVRVKAPDETILCERSNALPVEIESCLLPSTGAYTILADDLLEVNTGEYYLYLQRLNAPGGAVPIAFGQTLYGSITMPAEIDSYTFSAIAGDKVLVRMSRASGLITLEVRVFGPTGALQCEKYNSLPAEIESCLLPSTGTYTILADDLRGVNSGEYYLYLQRLNNPGGAVPIAFGQTLYSSIALPAEIDTYTFSAVAGDKVLVRMSRASGLITLEVRVFGPNGALQCERYNSLPAEIESCLLPSTGTYTILADDMLGVNTSEYYLYLQRLNDPGGALPIAFSQTLNGSIMPGEIDTYTFSAVAEDKVLVRMSRVSGLITLEVRVFGPNGALLCEAYNSLPAEIESCTLPSTGTYTILADDKLGVNSGDYLLYLQRLNAPLTPYSVFMPSIHK